MFAKTIEYKDFNGVSHTEDFYFHILTPEMADLEFDPTFAKTGRFSDYVKEAMRSGDGLKIYTFFKLMIHKSYGRRSEDGSKFIKKPEYTEEFLNSPAYEEFFLWLVEDPKNAEAFFLAIMPERLLQKVDELEAKQDKNNKKNLQDMSKEELVALMQKTVEDKKTVVGSL